MNRPSCANEANATSPAREASSEIPSASERLAVLDSQSVLQGRSSVAIEHNGAVYRLQTTRQGKLILTK